MAGMRGSVISRVSDCKQLFFEDFRKAARSPAAFEGKPYKFAMIRSGVADVAFCGATSAREFAMTSKFLVAAAAAVIVGTSGLALAQEDHNNPAPSYSTMTPTQSQNVQHIQDGNNGAPRYGATASTSGASNQQVTHIQDGNNPAPRYGAGSTTPPKATARTKATGTHATTKKRGNQG
jgi:hypothetical protein